MLVEIKYAAELELKRAELQPKFDAAIRYAEERGFEFNVITELAIRTEYLNNLKFLSRYKDPLINNVFAQQIYTCLTNKASITANELLTTNNAHHNNARILHTLWQMISAQILTFDLNNKITMSTKIWMNKR